MIDTLAPIIGFLMSAFGSLFYFVPAWIARRLLRRDNYWIRPALWAIVFVAWSIPMAATSGMPANFMVQVLWDSFQVSAILCLPWSLIGAYRFWKRDAKVVTNG